MKNGSAATSAALAVLPFANLSGEERFEFFSRELVEEFIIDLSHFSALEIISSYTSSRLNDPDLDEIEEARKIDIDYLLKGSLHLQSESIRLNTQLLDTENRKIIWAERFDAPLDSIFEIQESIAERVVFTISAEVDNNVLKSARKKPTTSLAAYECWLRGMDRLRLGTLEADHEARVFFNQALTIDPNYSRAYVGLSLSHFNEWSCQLWELYEQSEQSAFNYAIKAFHLDETDHIVQMILGRVYIYRRQFEEAEYHIERSLELNSNDADNLVQLSTCLAFLGRAAEGERIFKKALRLNPYRNLWYYQYGSFTYFVQKKYKLAIDMALKRQIVKVWVDLPAEIAAAYAHLGETELARQYLYVFIDEFTSSINKGKRAKADEIIDWIRRANPFRYQEDIDCYVNGLLRAGLQEVLTDVKDMGAPWTLLNLPEHRSIFKKEQAIWHFEFERVEATMPDLKGFHDIAALLAAPENEIHCTELMGSESSMAENDVAIDDQAKSAYKKHINDLEQDIEEAKVNNDIGRKEALQKELDQIIDHLSKNLGLGKRSRKMKSPADRARAAVTLRIRSAIKRLTEHHPALGKHLTNSVRTGVFCGYFPEKPREWILH